MIDTKSTRADALLRAYQTINSPGKAGPKWVTYSRGQVDAVLDALKHLLVIEGFMFRSEGSAEPSEVAK